MRIGSLFSGIGGLELGLEWAGLGPVVWQVEQDAWCRSVLARHWPDADRSVTDVRAATASNLAQVDLICGGFPCQDVSSAGKGAGLEGARSGLWYEYARIIGELRPRVVVVENVASGAKRWLDTVCDALDAMGYRVRPFGLSAADVGAPHRRRRVFVVAADAERAELRNESGRSSGPNRADASEPRDDGAPQSLADANVQSGNVRTSTREDLRDAPRRGWWSAEPDVGRVAHGVSSRLDSRIRRCRLRGLGNAVVPQCAEAIGRIVQEIA